MTFLCLGLFIIFTLCLLAFGLDSTSFLGLLDLFISGFFPFPVLLIFILGSPRLDIAGDLIAIQEYLAHNLRLGDVVGIFLEGGDVHVVMGVASGVLSHLLVQFGDVRVQLLHRPILVHCADYVQSRVGRHFQPQLLLLIHLLLITIIKTKHASYQQ